MMPSMKFILVALLASCTTAQRSAAGHAIIECSKQQAGPIVDELARLARMAIIAGHVDWQALEDAAFAAGETIGGCAYLAFTRAMTTSSAPTLLPDPGAASLARLSARFGGVEWK